MCLLVCEGFAAINIKLWTLPISDLKSGLQQELSPLEVLNSLLQATEPIALRHNLL